MKAKVVYLKDKRGRWRFRVVGGNGEIVCQSQAYSRCIDAKRGFEDLTAICYAISASGEAA